MSAKETKKFDAEVGKVLNLMIHSLYTNKDIFIRELISNASDACDKLRYLSQTDAKLMDGNSEELCIDIAIDMEARILRLKDNGIGMNKGELIENLGRIAHSGTSRFLDSMTGDNKKDSMLIGQFGVGFYSVFMVSDDVTVISQKAGENKAYKWQSNGQDSYDVEEYTEDFARGTEIIIHIKEEYEEFVDQFRVKHIVKNYSDHIAASIYFNEENDSKVKLNSASALWTKSKSEITDEQYQEFYKTVSHATDSPWMTLHNKNEGMVEFTNLLFIPENKTFDLFHPDRRSRVKLYIKRVFITDENVELIPAFMRFMRGVVDSEDLPLNISRETLQHNATIERIKQAITKRILTELNKKKDSDRTGYESFWQNFGAVLKEGLCEASPHVEKIMEASLFWSCMHNKYISLDEYIANIEGDQKTIYYLSGENRDQLKNSPQIEGFLSKGIDVLLFTDSVDDFWVNVQHEYKEHAIKSVTRSDIDLEQDSTKDDSNDKEEKTSQEHEKLVSYFKEVLGGKVQDVRVSKKLTSSPVCLAVAEGAMDIRMERFLVEQKQLAKTTAKILEINASHPILQKIEKDILAESTGGANSDLVMMLYDQACIIEGEPVLDAAEFCARVNKFTIDAISE